MSAVNYMKRGNKFYLLIGGATGMIGDPGGKDSERSFLSEEALDQNQQAIHKQVTEVLAHLKELSGYDFDFEVVNNFDFYKDMNFLRFLREVGKYITVNTMMTKETVKKRIEDPDKSISYTEFSYMLIQGYDFVHLFENKGVKLQISGSDQRGNCVTGTELIRKKLDKEAYVFTSPLILDANGKKFGKSEGNAIWLDRVKNSPYFVYQYFMNTTDEDVERFLKLLTLLEFDEIDQIVQTHQEKPELRHGQAQLAKYVVTTIFGPDEAQQAEKISQILFGNDKLAIIADMSPSEKQALATETGGMETTERQQGPQTAVDMGILDLCVATGLTASKGDARKMIKSNAISLNEAKVEDENMVIGNDDFVNGVLLLRKGKKTYKTIVNE